MVKKSGIQNFDYLNYITNEIKNNEDYYNHMTLSPTRILTVLASLALSITMSAQNVSISGQVLDASNGEPVIGAGVLISSGGGTVTDYDGKYEWICIPYDRLRENVNKL